MRQKEVLIAPVAVDANGIALVQTVTGAGTVALVLNGALVTASVFTADFARRVAIISSGNDSGITFTIVGTNAEGLPLSEAVTGGNAATVESAKYFKTITSITASAAAAANVTVGTVDEFVTAIIPLNHYASNPATIVIEGVSGTLDVSIEQTFSRIQAGGTIIFFAGPAGLTNETADAVAEIDSHATGVRLVCNSYTTSASLGLVVIQDRRC